MNLANVKRGDEVFVVALGFRRDDGVQYAEYMPVVAAGPKYVTAGTGYKQAKFHRDSGAEASDYAARKFAFVSEADWRAEEARKALVARANKLLHNVRTHNMSAAQLQALLAVLEPTP